VKGIYLYFTPNCVAKVTTNVHSFSTLRLQPIAKQVHFWSLCSCWMLHETQERHSNMQKNTSDAVRAFQRKSIIKL